jgi:hypothetical protein
VSGGNTGLSSREISGDWASEATLSLVNGRRNAAERRPGTRVDICMLPRRRSDHIEILTDGGLGHSMAQTRRRRCEHRVRPTSGGADLGTARLESKRATDNCSLATAWANWTGGHVLAAWSNFSTRRAEVFRSRESSALNFRYDGLAGDFREATFGAPGNRPADWVISPETLFDADDTRRRFPFYTAALRAGMDAMSS